MVFLFDLHDLDVGLEHDFLADVDAQLQQHQIVHAPNHKGNQRLARILDLSEGLENRLSRLL